MASDQVPNDANASGRSFGADELAILKQVLASGILIPQWGTAAKRFQSELGDWLGVRHCEAVASGTAALHTAIAAVDPAPGDEIISSPITDMGAVMPIVYQTAVPIFADVDPLTCNVTAETIAERIGPRTRAVIVTHLFGMPADMDPIVELARSRGIMVIEDAAQALGATYKGRKAGTLGDIGCFSLQQGKHITCGEGGFVVTADPQLARRMKLFRDKGWEFGGSSPDHEFLALNYRMSELQAAVALAQLGRLDAFLDHRRKTVARFNAALAGIEGLRLAGDSDSATHVYWRYPLRIEPPLGADVLDRTSDALRRIGARTAPRYTQKLAFEYRFLAEKERAAAFGGSGFPFVGPQRAGGSELSYDRVHYPGAVAALERLLCIGWNERYDDAVVDRIAAAVRKAVAS